MSGRPGQHGAAQLRRTLNQALHLWPVAKERNLTLRSLRGDHKHHILRSATLSCAQKQKHPSTAAQPGSAPSSAGATSSQWSETEIRCCAAWRSASVSTVAHTMGAAWAGASTSQKKTHHARRGRSAGVTAQPHPRSFFVLASSSLRPACDTCTRASVYSAHGVRREPRQCARRKARLSSQCELAAQAASGAHVDFEVGELAPPISYVRLEARHCAGAERRLNGRAPKGTARAHAKVLSVVALGLGRRHPRAPSRALRAGVPGARARLVMAASLPRTQGCRSVTRATARDPSLASAAPRVVAAAHAVRAVSVARLTAQSLRKLAVGALASLVVTSAAPATAVDDGVGFLNVPRRELDSRPEVAAIQVELIEAGRLVEDQFYDPEAVAAARFEERLHVALKAVHESSTVAEARAQSASLFATLGDPYTRIMRPRDFNQFRTQNDGQLTGVGLVVTSSAASGRLVVISPLANSPAARAGVRAGDEILSIDGAPLLRGINTEEAATRLRGAPGSSVQLRLRHTDTVPGAASRPPFSRVRNVRLAREVIELSPVQAQPLRFVTDGELHTVGYVRLSTFSGNASRDLTAALAKLREEGATGGVVLDMRGNGGGLVSAGLEVARTFLEPGDIIVSTLDRTGAESIIGLAPASEPASSTVADSQRQPVVVLIDGESASATEIVAAALRENGRALIAGTKSYGKGKIQSVYELSDGSAFFLTVASYRTPSGANIDHAGIQPDVVCAAPPEAQGALENDPCIFAAQKYLAGQRSA